MKKYLVSFASFPFYESQKKLRDSATEFGIDGFFSYNKLGLKKTSFYKENKEILDLPRGAGYWLWKPYIILDAMKKIKNGDILVYSDADLQIIGDLNVLFELCKKSRGIMLFGIGFKNKQYTKRDCFVLMGCDSKKYWDAQQLMTGFQIYIKNKKSIQLVKEWLHYCKQKNIITDSPNYCGPKNFNEFIEHRHDQSILSILAKKNKITLFRDPTHWGDKWKGKTKKNKNSKFSNSPYGTLVGFQKAGISVKQIINGINKIDFGPKDILRHLNRLAKAKFKQKEKH